MATRKRASKKRVAAGPKITKSAMTLISYKKGSYTESYKIQPTTNGQIYVEAPCGGDVEMTKAVALAVGQAILDTANTL